MISTLFTSLLAIWLLILSARVIALRGASFLKFFAFNNFGEKALSRSVRAQGNFIEYTPFFLILLFIAHIILNEKKSQHAQVNSILIDDYIENIIPWREKGGIAIHHKNTDDTIKELKNILQY